MYFWKVAYFTTLCLCEHHSVIFVSEWKNQVLEGSGLRSTNGLSIVKLKRRKSSLFNFVSTHGRNQVNETARHGIIAHRLWEENLGNITKVFVNDSFGIVAQTLSQKGLILNYYFLFWDRVQATKPKTSGNKPKGIVIFPKFSSHRY